MAPDQGPARALLLRFGPSGMGFTCNASGMRCSEDLPRQVAVIAVEVMAALELHDVESLGIESRAQ
jgi:hypothetical protein